MSPTQNMLLTLSLVGWFGLIAFEGARKKSRSLTAAGIQLALLAVLGYSLHRWFGYLNDNLIKAPFTVSEGWTLGGLYLATVLGIAGQHVFIQIKGLGEAGRQKRLKWLPLLKPLVISPLIFLAVLSQLTKMGVQANTLTAVVTQFAVAFQNGFFWKTIMEHVERNIAKE